MKKNMMHRLLFRSIRMSLGRYIAIVAIIALGAAIFVGLRTTKSDMIATGQQYMDEQNMFDLRLLNTYGWSKEDVEAISDIEGVVDAEGIITMDAIASFEGSDTESVYKLYSIPEKVNKVYLHGGRMPQSPDECLADGFHTGDNILGMQITVSDNNEEDTLNSLKHRTFTVVGYVSTPLYMDISRGNTTLGNGSVAALLYLPAESFDVDYYTEIDITLPGEEKVYTEAYDALMEQYADRLEAPLRPIADARFEKVLAEAKEAYEEGMSEYEDGLKEYEKGKADAHKELADAKKKLEEGQAELNDKKKLVEDNEKLLDSSRKQVEAGLKNLANGRVTLAKAKADAFSKLAQASSELMNNYRQVNDGLAQLNSGISQIDSGLSQIDSGISQLESGLQTLSTTISVTETMLDLANSSLTRAEAALQRAQQSGQDTELIRELEATVNDARQQGTEYETQLSDMKQMQQEYSAQLTELQTQRAELAAQRDELVAARAPLLDAQKQIDQGFVELQATQTQTENQFAAAEAQIEASAIQLESAQAEIKKGEEELAEGKKALEQGQKDLEQGWKEYYEGEAEVNAELTKAKQELDDAKQQLADALETIEGMESPDLYLLDRNTNMGYLALDNNSSIVEGVSQVFPAFFLLIAALVCITTMTRMVEDERTQIGTLKSLGYSNWGIIGKYLAYAGSAAIIGCGLGVFAGSAVFPTVLWQAYQIIMFLGDYFVLRIDWTLCLLVVLVYTAVTLLVTWYCCRMSLREEPSELIRPKAPTSGKKILLERLPFWNKFSFLNKVMLRNIFRYRQRLLMMLVGIGGCTALLLTGFGIRDSINDLATNQFSEVILYDVEARFDHSMSQQEQDAFREEHKSLLDSAFFFHQSSMELSFADQVKDVSFIAADRGLERYIDFHTGRQPLPMPGKGEALISKGASEMMGIRVGDTITVRDADMRALQLKVTGVFDNNVYHYVICSTDTVISQWGASPDRQMACMFVADKVDVHELGIAVSESDGVMNVTVNADVEDNVGNMLEALDLVIVTIVICSTMLAVIVLYNLTNINITERIREIATIKVLGFHDLEAAAYVFKENLLLSAMGAVLGLGGGIFLLQFVMSKIRIDMMWVTTRLSPWSFLWSLVITMLAAFAVDFVLYFKLNKINMAEALKSVE